MSITIACVANITPHLTVIIPRTRKITTMSLDDLIRLTKNIARTITGARNGIHDLKRARTIARVIISATLMIVRPRHYIR